MTKKNARVHSFFTARLIGKTFFFRFDLKYLKFKVGARWFSAIQRKAKIKGQRSRSVLMSSSRVICGKFLFEVSKFVSNESHAGNQNLLEKFCSSVEKTFFINVNILHYLHRKIVNCASLDTFREDSAVTRVELSQYNKFVL